MADMSNDRNQAGQFVVGNQASKGKGRPRGSKKQKQREDQAVFQ